MAHYTLAAAYHSPLVHTWVFTDDAPLQGLTQAFSPRVQLTPFARPTYLSQAHTTSEATLQWCLQQLTQTSGYPLPPWCMLLQVTSPQRTAAHIAQALALLAQHPQADGLISVVPPEKPSHWLYGHTDGVWLDTTPLCPQATQTWLPNGAIYVVRTALALQQGTLTHGRMLRFAMTTRQDVDTPQDIWPQPTSPHLQQVCQPI
jgi:CMP-N-acetylneuraminic acid synthetase